MLAGNRDIKMPTVFISYSWDDDSHQNWVLELARIIRGRGAEVIIDKTHMKLGAHMKTFMIRSVLDADIVLIVLTPEYKLKADGLVGGAGYEYNLISEEMFKVTQSNRKFIPILRKGDFQNSVTVFLRAFRCADLRDSSDYSKNLDELLTHIFDTKLN